MPLDFRKSKLGFANPLKPSSDDISYDPYDLQDPTTAANVISAKEDVFERRNVFKGTNEYTALVITPPEDLISSIVSGVYTAFQIGIGEQSKIVRLKVHIPELHACLGNPCDIGHYERASSEKEKLAIAEQIIENHPWVTARVNLSLFENPSFGDIIKIKFTKGPSGGAIEDAEVVQIMSRGNAESIKTYCDATLVDKYASTIPTVFGMFGNFFGGGTDASGSIQSTGNGSADIAIQLAFPYVGNPDRDGPSRPALYRVVKQLNRRRAHLGSDIGMRVGTKLYSCADGVIVDSGQGSAASGIRIRIRHPQGFTNGDDLYTAYMHLSKTLVREGQEVKRGQLIALSGNTGGSTGPHLHLEIRRKIKGLVGGFGYPEDFTVKPGEENTSEGQRRKKMFSWGVYDPLEVITLPCVPIGGP